jgi:hypothetical protein
MKKITLVLIIALFLVSCTERDGNSIAAAANVDWTQVTDPGSEMSFLSIVYSIKNTGKEDLVGYSIVFEYSGGFAGSVPMGGVSISQGEPDIFPVIEKELDDPILPAEIYVDEATYSLTSGTVISSVEVSKLHVWSENKERIYEY